MVNIIIGILNLLGIALVIYLIITEKKKINVMKEIQEKMKQIEDKAENKIKIRFGKKTNNLQ
jgi:uncharacterized protein YoxC